MRSGCGSTWPWASTGSALACRRVLSVLLGVHHAHSLSRACLCLSQPLYGLVMGCRPSELHCIRVATSYATGLPNNRSLHHRAPATHAKASATRAQAFQQPLLEACGRSHSLAEARAALDAVRAAGPRSWSLDLISGLPGLTRAAWRESLSAAIAADPPHISVYDLQAMPPLPRCQSPR